MCKWYAVDIFKVFQNFFKVLKAILYSILAVEGLTRLALL